MSDSREARLRRLEQQQELTAADFRYVYEFRRAHGYLPPDGHPEALRITRLGDAIARSRKPPSRDNDDDDRGGPRVTAPEPVGAGAAS